MSFLIKGIYTSDCVPNGRSGLPLHEATGSISTPPKWDTTPSQVYPKYSICQDPFIHLGRERDHCGSKVSYPRTRPQARTAQVGDELTDHEATNYKGFINSVKQNLHLSPSPVKRHKPHPKVCNDAANV